MQLEEIVNLLQQTYCQNIGFEFMHLSDKSEREWIARALETAHAAPVSDETKRRHWRLLHDSEIFDHFLGKRLYVTSPAKIASTQICALALASSDTAWKERKACY